jgi:ABC-2 type transport system ATP-binding protein
MAYRENKTMDNPAIKITNLTKSFGSSIAVDNLSLEVRKGELFGLVGPDGAGKTTVMRLLTAIMEPASGEAWVGSRSILTEGEEIKENIGYMPQQFGLYEDLTVMENILFYADIYDVPENERHSRMKQLLGFSNLTPFTGRLAGKLSGGMKQKLGLACALIHRPEILFLDEPTNGVDPVSRRDFWKILYSLLKDGVTIFVSTAYLDEAERCTEIGLLYNGKLLIKDKPAEIKKAVKLPMLELWSNDPHTVKEALIGLSGIQGVSIYGDRLHIALMERSMINEIIEKLKAEGIEIKDYREILPSIEDVFISMVGKQ